MTSEHRPIDPLEEARTLASERRWEEAALRFLAGGNALLEGGSEQEAQAALAAAGDAAWRADLPDLAMRCFVRARELLGPGSPGRRLRALQMAAVFVDLGELESAAIVLEEARDGILAPDLDLVRLDTLMGLEMVRGRVVAARGCLGELERLAGEFGSPVILFRQGQVAAREGDLGGAVEALSVCAGLIGDQGSFQGPLGATLLELAEIALLRGDTDDAQALLDRAGAAWGRAGRRAGMARTAAMRARATAGSAGGGVSALAPWLAFAEQRGLRLLEAEILLALGETQLGCDPDSARGRLMQAVDVAGRIGAHHVRGRALLFLHDQPRGDPAALKIAISDLDEAAPWRCRALVALARRLAEDGRERERALELCASALCRFGDMDLPRDEANARGLLWKLSARG